jgi:hypothetical protein
MLRVWGKFFNVRTYIDDTANFWQAVAVLQR